MIESINNIPEEKRHTVNVFIRECEEQISAYLNTPVHIAFTVHFGKTTEAMIRAIVLENYAVTWDQIISGNRKRHIVTARHAYAWLCRKFTNLTFNEIGENINRDHSSAMHGISTVNDLLFVRDEVTVSKLTPIVNHLQKVNLSESV